MNRYLVVDGEDSAFQVVLKVIILSQWFTKGDSWLTPPAGVW